MTHYEFQSQMVRLVNQWKHAFSEERTRLIFEAVSDMDLSWFTKLCNHMIGDMRYAPLVKDFREAAYKQRSSLKSQEILDSISTWDNFNEKWEPQCWDCGDSGELECWKLPAKIYRKQFRCPCPKGFQSKLQNIWGTEFESRYELEPWGEPVSAARVDSYKNQWRQILAKWKK
jgi:hypothetical protein